MKAIRLAWHKFWARKHYMMKRIMENSANCGLGMLTEVSSEYRNACRKFEYHYEQCKKLDPLCP